ncbi:MAG: efflux RND transporter periplasmic adaptor subunit [Bacteroidales bacterium]|nr:efflux RND transporter periplasmic adaptor subunit [Bacteroidales bacterium]
MKKYIYIIIAVAVIAIVVIRLKSNKETTANRVYQYDKEQVIKVQVIKLKSDSVNNNIFYAGTFEPYKESKISADIQGKINSVPVDVGTTVRKGQALIQLDHSLLKLQLQAVEVQIEGLEADVKRYTILANADAIQGVQLEKAVLGLKAATVQKATLTEQIKKTTIVAPFSGIVTAKFTEEGAFAMPGAPLLQITDISQLKFTINISEQELFQFRPNRNHTLTADIYPEAALSGKVIMIGSKANMGNGFQVQFLVNNTADLKIKSGMFGKVNVSTGANAKQVVIPASSVVGTNIQPQVYTVKNGKAILQPVTISSRFQNKAVVSGGLAEGDVIITNGFINLYDGANVNFE